MINNLKRVIAAASLCFMFMHLAHGAVTVTDANGVVYDVVSQDNHTVQVSKLNASLFSAVAADIVIPPTVIDVATTAVSSDPYTVTGIVEGAFRGSAIRSIDIQAPLTTIPRYTFYDCKGLQSVTLTESVKTIAQESFVNCNELQSIGTLEGVTQIGQLAFLNCQALDNVVLGPNLTTMGEQVFGGCKSLHSITIPASLATLPRNTFRDCESLETVVIEEGVKVLDNYAFYRCASLRWPQIPSTVTTVGQYTFAYCKSLGDVVLPAGIKWISYAFQYSTIQSLRWAEGPLGSFDQAMFKNVDGLRQVTIPGKLTVLPSNFFAQCADLESVTMEEGVAEIGTGCFLKCTKLTTLQLPQSLETIRQNAFNACESLQDFDFPQRMTLIETGVFPGCYALREVRLPAGASLATDIFGGLLLTSIIFPDEPMGTFAGKPFGQQNNIKHMRFPGWLKEIPASICYQWWGLESVEIDEGVEAIGNSAFCKASAMTSINFPSTLRTIGNNAFENAQKMEIPDFPDGLESIGQQAFLTLQQTTRPVVIPASVHTIGNQAFQSCSKIPSVEFAPGSALKTLGQHLFNGCSELVSVILPDNLERIEGQVFTHCSKLLMPTLPATLSYIGNQAFCYCKELGEVTLSAGMTIDDNAFSYAGVTAIHFPDEPCTFGSDVFNSNSKMSAITFPQWMTAIPAGFCYNWSLLDHVEFGDHVESVGDRAFRSCPLLHDVEFKPSIKSLGTFAFAECAAQTKPLSFGAVDLYEGVEIGDNAFYKTPITSLNFHGCAEFGTDCFKQVTTIESIEFPDCMEEIPDGFCSGWAKLAHVVIPEGVKRIGASAFKSTALLTEENINFPTTLESIGDGAFNACGFTTVPWPGQPITLGKEVFGNCSKLLSVEIPAYLNGIPEKTFSVCNNLASVTYAPREPSDQPFTYGTNAFSSCYALTEITFPEQPLEIGDAAFSGCNHVTDIRWKADQQVTFTGTKQFQNCNALTQVRIPDTVEVLPVSCFNSCSALAHVDLGGGVKEVSNNCFEKCALTSVTWSPQIHFLGQHSFASNKFKDLTIPGGITNMSSYAFSPNADLETVTLLEGAELIGTFTFSACKKLHTVILPSTMRNIQQSAFNQCESLANIELNEGLTTLGKTAFNNCLSLRHVAVPSTVTTMDVSVFNNCTSLETADWHAATAIIPQNTFNGCTSLRTFTADAGIKYIHNNAFYGCSSLTDFIYTGDTYILGISGSAFCNCASLRDFPYLQQCSLSSNCFAGCTSLGAIRLAESGGRTMSNNYDEKGYFNGDTSLQSVVWPHTTKYFNIHPLDFQNCPLEALSYSYARNITMPTTYFGNNTTIADFNPTAAEAANLTTPAKSKLMVMRGEKWKYMEKGYGQMFDIVEMRDPQFNIEGDIFSTYDTGLNLNHYKVNLRWDVPLSDLNPDGPTFVHVFRDGKKIADVEFSRPSEPMAVEGMAADRVIAVEVKVNGEMNEFTGDFDFPVTDDKGNTLYIMQYARETPVMYFDAVTHRRQVAVDKYGHTSYFVLVDEFDSPRLDSADIPSYYSYTAVMDGYEYDEWVNNDGLTPGDDGLRYHKERRSFESLTSDPALMYTAIAVPQLQMPGLYTLREILDDRDASLSVSPQHSNKKQYKFSYELDLDLVNQKGRLYDAGATDVLKTVEVKEVNDDNTLTTVDTPGINRNTGKSEVTLSGDRALEPGHRYQTLVSSDFRGTFGSGIITVPDAPTMEAFITADFVEPSGDHAGHLGSVYRSTLYIYPNVEGMGYTEPLRPEDYHLGLWRDVTLGERHKFDWEEDLPDAATLSLTASSMDLLHHAEGAVEDAPQVDCDGCANALSHGETTLTYTDHYEVPRNTDHVATYIPRLYVKVPDGMLSGEPRYMLVDTLLESKPTTILGLDAAADDLDPLAPARYYNLQGISVATPVAGNVYLRVTGNTATKVIAK